MVVILAFQVFGAFQGKAGDVYFYVAQGNAKILPYGTSEWQDAFSGTKLLAGDSVKTLKGGRLVFQFYNGSVVRLDQDSEITLADVSKRSGDEKIALTLDFGAAWVNRVITEDTKTSKFELKTDHMLVKDVGNIIEVEKATATEVVRVLKGAIKVDIYANDNNKNEVADTQDVGVGQELDLDPATLKSFMNHENPSALVAIRDEFKGNIWYAWNVQEDETATDFARQPKPNVLAGGTSSQTQASSQTQGPAATQNSGSQTVQQTQSNQVPKVTITSPAQPEVTVTTGKLTITGTASSGTAKIFVTQTLAGTLENYQLQKFKVGDPTFTYNLAESYGNLKQGDNTYVFYGVDVDGHKGTSTAQVVVHDNVAGSTQQTQQTQATQQNQALTAPKVLSFNGANSSTVTVGVVKVLGEVHGAAKVIVNGFTLGKFVPGTTSWTYYANENGDNLKPGVNDYDAYAVDAQGNESEHFKFTITYNKPVVAPATQSTQATSPTQAQVVPQQ